MARRASVAASKVVKRFDQVKAILDAAAGSSKSDYGGPGRFWDDLDNLKEAKVYGVRMIAPEQKECDALEQPRLRDHGHEQRQAEDEQHRVGVNQIVEAAEREEVMLRPGRPAMLGDFDVMKRRLREGAGQAVLCLRGAAARFLEPRRTRGGDESASCSR